MSIGIPDAHPELGTLRKNMWRMKAENDETRKHIV